MENETKVSPALFQNGQKFLITSDTWFVAPDGEYYNGAFGPVKIVDAESVLGIKSNARSSNWYAIVGYENQSVCIAGCQIHGAVRTDEINLESGAIREDYKIEATNKARPRVWTPTGIKKAKPIDLGEFKFSVDTTGFEKIIDHFGKVKRLFDAYNPPIVTPLRLATPIVVKPESKTIFPITEYNGPCWSWINEENVIDEFNLWEVMEKRLARNLKGVGIVHPPEIIEIPLIPSYMVDYIEQVRRENIIKSMEHMSDALQYSMYAEGFFHSEPINSAECLRIKVLRSVNGHREDSDLIDITIRREVYQRFPTRTVEANFKNARKRMVDLYLALLSDSEENGIEFSKEMRASNLEVLFKYLHNDLEVMSIGAVKDEQIFSVLYFMREALYWPFGVDKFINKYVI